MNQEYVFLISICHTLHSQGFNTPFCIGMFSELIGYVACFADVIFVNDGNRKLFQ